MALSQLFGVTLDELVTGETPPLPGPGAPPPAARAPARPLGQVVAGGALLALAGMVFLALLPQGGGWGSVFYGLFFLPPAVVCLGARRHFGLWLAWGLCISGDLLVRFCTAVTWRYVLLTPHFSYEMNYVRLALGWSLFLAMLGCTLATLWTFREAEPPKTNHPNRLLGCIGLLLIGATCLREAARQAFWTWCMRHPSPSEELLYVDRWGGLAGDYLILALLILALLWGRAAWRKRKARGR